MAAAIGIGVDVEEPMGNMIIDIGGGTSEIAVIALGGIVTDKNIRVAGDELTQDIEDYMRRHHNILIGERTAEQIKIAIGSAYPEDEIRTMHVKGRDLVAGIPKTIEVTSEEIREAMQEPWNRLYEEVQHIRDKMITKEDGKPQKLYQSMLDNALGLCSTLKSLNILDDIDLEAARRALELSLTDVDIKSLRESPEMRHSIITKMDELKDKFSLDI